MNEEQKKLAYAIGILCEGHPHEWVTEMDDWRDVATKRIEDTIKDIEDEYIPMSSNCPVCTFFVIVADMNVCYHPAVPCENGNGVKCPAHYSCVRYCSIIDTFIQGYNEYQHDEETVEELREEAVGELEWLLDVI